VIASLDGIQGSAAVQTFTPPVTPPISEPCLVPKARTKTLKRAKRLIRGHGCTVGRIKHAPSRTVKKGHVISQEPKAGRRLKHGARVSLVVSVGRPRPRG
jgi:beta-lactam-binding protein with PASTA domain